MSAPQGQGRIIFLHGPSSSGKSTLARAVQQQAVEPFLHLSIDTLRDGGAFPKTSAATARAMRPHVFSGLHNAVAAFAHAGNNVIFEHILDTQGWREELREVLTGIDVLCVGVYCALPILQAREQARGDRLVGSAETDFHKVHKDMRYDLDVNGEDPPAEQATRVLAALADPARTGL